MFDGIKNRFKNLQYGSIEKRRKAFWIAAIGIFAVIIIVWVLGGIFLNFKEKSGSDVPLGQIQILWSQTKEQWQKLTDSARNTLESIGSSTETVVTSTATSSLAGSSAASASSTDSQ